MGLPYMPELAAWPAMVAGGMVPADYDVVENERFVNGEKVYEAADKKKVYEAADEMKVYEAADEMKVYEAADEKKVKVYEAADEKKVEVKDHSGTGTKVVRCVEYPVAAGPSMPATVLLFTVTEGAEGKEVAEVVEDGAALVLELAGGECFYDEETGTWEHIVDVQTHYDAFIAQVSVREDDDGGDDDHVVCISRWLN